MFVSAGECHVYVTIGYDLINETIKYLLQELIIINLIRNIVIYKWSLGNKSNII